MVGTRKSAPDLKAAAPGAGENVPKALRMLHIDGKETMYGEAKKTTVGDVYHWRGAVYVVTADTPQEWIDAEPVKNKAEVEQRGKKRKSTQNGGDAIPETRPTKRSRSMPDFQAAKTKNTATSAPKRKRPAVQKLPAQAQLAGAEPDEKDEDEPQPKRQKSIATIERECKAKRKQALEEARKMGNPLQSKMLSDKDMLPPEEPTKEETTGYKVLVGIVKMARLNSRIEKFGTLYHKMKERGAYSGIIKKGKRRARSPHTQIEERQPEVEDDVEEEPEIEESQPDENPEQNFEDERTAARQDDDDGIDELSADFMDQVQQYSQQADLEEEESIRAQLDRQLQAASDEEEEAPIEQEPDTATDSSDSHYKPYRWDSAASFPDNSDVPASTSSHTSVSVEQENHDDEQEDDESTSPQVQIKPRFNLPAHNQGGKRLRWSIDGMRFTSPQGNTKSGNNSGVRYTSKNERVVARPPPKPQHLADRLSNEERAENMIFRGRMEGESHSARRRRIAREMKVLRDMPVVSGDED